MIVEVNDKGFDNVFSSKVMETLQKTLILEESVLVAYVNEKQQIGEELSKVYQEDKEEELCRQTKQFILT